MDENVYANIYVNVHAMVDTSINTLVASHVHNPYTTCLKFGLGDLTILELM